MGEGKLKNKFKFQISRSQVNFLVFGTCVVAIGCYLYFGYLIYLYAQESKKEASLNNRENKVEAVVKEEVIEDPVENKEVTPVQAPAQETVSNALDAVEAVVSKDSTLEEKKETPGEDPFLKKESDLPKDDRAKQAITVNGDKVEYSTDSKLVTAEGDVEVLYKSEELRCQKLTLNTQTKEGEAEGNVSLNDPNVKMTGSKMTYNFQNKSGSIYDATFKSQPYFGSAHILEKLSDSEFIASNTSITSCNFDKPHYRIGMKKINFFQGDKIQAEDAVMYIGNIPVLYLPKFNRSLTDPIMHIQVHPGTRKDWGPYILNTWKTNLAENVDARLFLDYRNKLGVAEGFALNYAPPGFGNGDFKFYYTDEHPTKLSPGSPENFQRYLLRWRHKWDIDPTTNFISEFYKISDEKRKFDPNNFFLKDYFYREFEEDSQPLSYAQFHHSFPNSTFDFLVQARTNNWFDQLSKLPEVKYTLPSIRIGETPIFFESNTSVANIDKKASTEPVSADEVNVSRMDTTNSFSLPFKLGFFRLTPFLANRETIYDKGADGSTLPMRTIFYSGVGLSTKLFRFYDVKANFLGLDINGIRHVITPSIEYSYNHDPTIESDKLKQIDSIDSIDSGSVAYFGLSNKLQTKRNGKSVDLLDFRVSSAYEFDPRMEDGEKHGGTLDDVYFKLKILPFSWMRIESDAIYSTENNYFSDVNYDFNFNIDKDKSLGIGQRYANGGGNQITCGFNWRLNPKWKFSIYERYEMGDNPNLVRGLSEQEYTISRDLHCWTMDLTLNRKKEEGTSFWVIFRLKAFPESDYGFKQNYHEPQSGSQSNP